MNKLLRSCKVKLPHKWNYIHTNETLNQKEQVIVYDGRNTNNERDSLILAFLIIGKEFKFERPLARS